MENRLSDTYTATGTLIVTVFTANGALPVEGALVTVKGSSREDSGVISVVTTDRQRANAENSASRPARRAVRKTRDRKTIRNL